MAPGERVQVWVRFTETWSAGFEIAAVVDGGYQVRRCSDGFLLPAPTGEGDVRPHARGSAFPPGR